MSAPNWQRAEPVRRNSMEYDAPAPSDDPALYSWLCGCGQTRPYVDSPTYPICECGQRMRLLTAPHLGYVDSREQRIERLRARHAALWREWAEWRERIHRDRLAWDSDWSVGQQIAADLNRVAWEIDVA